MKVLVAIESSENPKTLAKCALRWAARAGFDLRIFIPGQSQLSEYKEAIDEANYNWYLAIPKNALITELTPSEFAKAQNYDLVLHVPDHLRKWDKKANHELNPYKFAESVGKARLLFADQSITRYVFENGAVMVRA